MASTTASASGVIGPNRAVHQHYVLARIVCREISRRSSCRHRYFNCFYFGMTTISLAAPTRTPATPAPITRSVPRHDAAAEAAGRGVAQVDDAGQRVRGVY